MTVSPQEAPRAVPSTASTTAGFASGSIVSARGRAWVVLPDKVPGLLVARPLNGDPELTAALLEHEVTEASFPRPRAALAETGDNLAAGLLRTALRVGFTSSAGPFRSLASIAVEPRQYQLVPLLLALKMETVRLLIGDDVGIGKTIEASLIAKELLEQGEIERFSILCSPALAEQWQRELATKFAIDATLVLPSTITRLSRDLDGDRSVFEEHPFTVVSTDFIKSESHRSQFLRALPDLVIVDEAHTCVTADTRSRDSQRRYDLLREVSKKNKHLVLVTATPHSGSQSAFTDLIGLLDPELARLDLEQRSGRERLARHFVQRRRGDIRAYLDEVTKFPRDRKCAEVSYTMTEEYRAFLDKVLDYARESAAASYGGSRLSQRLSWWSALALLRSAASSPAAAEATLRARSAAAAARTPEEADELGRSSVLDMAGDDQEIEGTDTAPGADAEALPGSARQRLLELADEAQTLRGRLPEEENGPKKRKKKPPRLDRKLDVLVEEIERLHSEGFDPIVFCRFIPTAHYVAAQLRDTFRKKAVIDAVTGELPPAERENRIGKLTSEPGRRILVATDCLSEGVNLQENFQAVIHYDLAWNPTRQEQREGRVDRFNQRHEVVQAITLYSQDNGVDGVVLDVLLRKQREIAKATGVAIPIPDHGDTLVQALVQGVLLRDETPPGQEALFARELVEPVHREWWNASERESRTVTKYAHSGIALEEVRKEADAARGAIGRPSDVAHFVRTSLSALGTGLVVRPDGLTAQIAGIRPRPRRALALPEGGGDLVFRAAPSARPGEHALVRTDPFVRDLARYVLDAALDPDANPKDSPARRCGVIRTPDVGARTTLLLARYRFHVTLPRKTTVAEDAKLFAFRGGPDSPDWLTDEEIGVLLGATAGNVLPELVQRHVERAIADLDDLQPSLDAFGEQLARDLLDSHRRVREATRTSAKTLHVTPSGHADVLGVYVYLPGGGQS